MIRIRVNPIEVIKKVYDLSSPQGLGYLHFQPGALSDEMAKQLIIDNRKINLDCVLGRSCKFHATITNDGMVEFDNHHWYDHSSQQLRELIAHLTAIEDAHA